MGLRNLPAIADALLEHGRSADSPAAVVQEATTGEQRVLRTTLGELASAAAAAGVRPPAVVVIGRVVDVLPPPA
jgi:uroporphyrin-III C-methyltransferase/precorrin-2 dehydrogenase/sirohydrochlorin ferrochelatase